MSDMCNANKNKEKNIKTKHITVYLNGRQNEKHKITLDTKRNPKWHHILNEITSKISPYFGVVKKLYSSESGVTICSFSDVENNGTYVASDSRQFQIVKGGYKTLDKEKNFEHYLTGQLNRNNKIKKLAHVRCDLIVIYVFNNGKDKDPPEKIVLSKRDLENWEHTLSYIALIVDMPFRTIKALYNSKGSKVCGPWELQHGASYIAVGYNEKFIRRKYKIRENTTEIWKESIPIVHKNKNEKCYHRHGTKSWKQNLEFKNSLGNIGDYSPLQSNKQSKYNSKIEDLNCCQVCGTSDSSDINTSTMFSMPSDKYGYLQDRT